MESIAKNLLEIGAVKLSPNAPFTWASGWKSPIYCNNREALSDVETQGNIVNALRDILDEEFPEADFIVGVATGAIAWGAMVSFWQDMGFAYVRSEAKDHGMKSKIEGKIPEGAKVVVIEDLVSTGGSSLKVVDTLREAGVDVVGMAAIFTYEFPQAQEAFADANVKLVTATNYSELLEAALYRGLIKEEDKTWLAEWRNSPETWGQD